FDAAAAAERDEPARQAKTARQQNARQHVERSAEKEGNDGQDQSADDRIDVEALNVDLHAGLPNLHAQRRLLQVEVARLLPVVQLLQRILHRLPALGPLGQAVGGRLTAAR